MNIEAEEHDHYNRIGKTIYGETDKRRWSDLCRCGGTRADHIRLDPEMNLDRPQPKDVSNNNHANKCPQFVPTKTPYFSRIKTIIEHPSGTEMATDDDQPNPLIKVEGRAAALTPAEIRKWRDELANGGDQ